MITQFALRMLCGISLMWCVMPRKQVTSGFFRIQSLVALGLAILAALTAGTWSGPVVPPIPLQTLCIAIAVLAWFGSVFWRIEWRPYGTGVVFSIAIISAVSLLLEYGLTEERAVSLRAVAEFVSAAQLGAVVTAMLLGHWYLTAPTMSIAPLSRLNTFFGATCVLRAVLSLVGYVLFRDALLSQTHWVWFVMRWAAGIIGPLIMCWMVVRILRFKNTQSATGVLFAGTILVFIGAMTAVLLNRELSAVF